MSDKETGSQTEPKTKQRTRRPRQPTFVATETTGDALMTFGGAEAEYRSDLLQARDHFLQGVRSVYNNAVRALREVYLRGEMSVEDYTREVTLLVPPHKSEAQQAYEARLADIEKRHSLNLEQATFNAQRVPNS